MFASDVREVIVMRRRSNNDFRGGSISRKRGSASELGTRSTIDLKGSCNFDMGGKSLSCLVGVSRFNIGGGSTSGLE